MSLEIKGKTYYRTAEVYKMLGISRNTLYRWLQKGLLGPTELRDARGWRLFTAGDIEQLDRLINRVVEIQKPGSKEL